VQPTGKIFIHFAAQENASDSKLRKLRVYRLESPGLQAWKSEFTGRKLKIPENKCFQGLYRMKENMNIFYID